MPNLDGDKYDADSNIFQVRSNSLTLNYLPTTGSSVQNLLINKVLVEVYSHRNIIYDTVDDAEVKVYNYKNKKLYRTPRDGLYTSMFVDVYGKYGEFIKLSPILVTPEVDTNGNLIGFNETNISTILNDDFSSTNNTYRFFYQYNNINTEAIKIVNNDKIFPAKVIVFVSSGPMNTFIEKYTYILMPNKPRNAIPFSWSLPYAIDGYYNKKTMGIYDGNNLGYPSYPDKWTLG